MPKIRWRVSKLASVESEAATPAMLNDTFLLFSLPAVQRKKTAATFDGGGIISDGSVMLLGAIEKQISVDDQLVAQISDLRNPLFITNGVADILCADTLAIACGYKDGDNLDYPHGLRSIAYLIPTKAASHKRPLHRPAIAISMDGGGGWCDNVSESVGGTQ